MFQRRHYKILAKILNKRLIILENTGEMYFDDLVHSFIKELTIDNPRFDKVKFIAECYREELK